MAKATGIWHSLYTWAHGEANMPYPVDLFAMFQGMAAHEAVEQVSADGEDPIPERYVWA